MRNHGLVSIITPSYNSATFIRHTINSVLSQTYENWEMIITDDCSSDNTAEIVSKFKDDRIHFHILPTNSGAAVARNTALRMAKGKWIAFLDSDDLWEPDKLIRQLDFMVDNQYDFTYTKYNEIDENGKPLGVAISGPKKISRKGMLAYCWPGCLTVMYNVESIGLIQIPPIQKNNDYAMWLLVSRQAECFLLPSVLASYRKRAGSISNQNKLSLIKWHKKLFELVEHANPLQSLWYTLNNLFWGTIKKIVYVKREKL